jgi:hypothetical protein
MRKLCLHLLLLLVTSPAYAEVVTFVWNHTELGVGGYKLYKSVDQQNWTELQNIPDKTVKTAQYNKTTETIECFGISAYSPAGEESPITTKTDAGEDVCLGKPAAPTTFSFSVP